MSFELCQPTLEQVRGRTGVKWGKYEGADVISAWVADMDFEAPAEAIDAMRSLLDQGATGYGNWPVPAMVQAWAGWQDRHFGWQPDVDKVQEFSSVIHALEVAMWLRSEPGDGVVVFMPVYHPFLNAIADSGRRRIEVPLDPDGWRLDPDRLRAAIDDTTRIILLCQPHNPTGRMMDDAEIAAIAEVADEFDLMVISDEIWGDLTFERSHKPLVTVDERLQGRIVTCCSASKTFNLAGTRVSVAHIDDDRLRETMASMSSHVFGGANTFGVAAATAAWTHGQPWLDALMVQLRSNRDLIARRLADECPAIGYSPPEATYLGFLDFRQTRLADDPATKLFDAGVGLSPGRQFGSQGEGWARINFATSEAILNLLLDRIIAAAS